VQLLRAAFDAAVKDQALLEDAKAQNMEIDPVTGAAINTLLDRVYAAAPELAARLRDMAK
jgi:hypothetical protein